MLGVDGSELRPLPERFVGGPSGEPVATEEPFRLHVHRSGGQHRCPAGPRAAGRARCAGGRVGEVRDPGGGAGRAGGRPRGPGAILDGTGARAPADPVSPRREPAPLRTPHPHPVQAPTKESRS
ncbi:hypothetical protein JCM4914_12970 [Streptomyces platensis subsp. malvinus]